jgi:hypothetical protein
LGITTTRRLGHDFGWKKIRSILMYHAATIDPQISSSQSSQFATKMLLLIVERKPFHVPSTIQFHSWATAARGQWVTVIGARNLFSKRKILWLEKTQRRVYCLG